MKINKNHTFNKIRLLCNLVPGLTQERGRVARAEINTISQKANSAVVKLPKGNLRAFGTFLDASNVHKREDFIAPDNFDNKLIGVIDVPVGFGKLQSKF